MTRLSGEFQTDLALPDALTACVDALDGLGWGIESVELNRILSTAGEGAATVEIDLGESDGGTDLRIAGADSEERPLHQDELIAVLDRARDAIGDQIEQAEGGDQAAAEEPNNGASGPELPAAGWFPDPHEAGAQRYWDGEGWTSHVRGPEGVEAAADERRQPTSWWQEHRRSLAIAALAFLVGGAVGAAANSSDTATIKGENIKTKRVQGQVRVRTRVKTVTETQTVKVPASSTGPTASVAGAAANSSSPSGGTSSAGCDQSYGPVCLDPNAADYDCKGGGGDGPNYVAGPVSIIGDDHYGLDTSDHDGVGCE